GQLEKAKELGGGDISTGIPDGVSAEVTEVKEVDDNTAEATFTATQDEKQKQAKFKFVKEDDEWKFCGLAGMPTMGSETGSGPAMPEMPSVSIPEMPDISVPEMPDLPDVPDLPNCGGQTPRSWPGPARVPAAFVWTAPPARSRGCGPS